MYNRIKEIEVINMEIRVLKYFLAIAKEESISKAAEYLHVSQPALSKQMRDLEERLGTTLFIRGSRKITLTEDGLLLRQRAQQIIDLTDRTETEIIMGNASLSGKVCIGCGETEGMQWIARAIKKVQILHPNIQFHLHSGNAEDIMDLLEKGLIDFGVVIGEVDLSKYHSFLLPIQDITGVLMLKDSPLAKKEIITAQDLIAQPLIISSQGLEKEPLPHYLIQNGNYHIVATYNLIYNASLLVKENVGYALGLDKLMNTNEDSELCFKPLTPISKDKISLIWKRFQHFSKPAQFFLNTFQTLLEQEAQNNNRY